MDSPHHNISALDMLAYIDWKICSDTIVSVAILTAVLMGLCIEITTVAIDIFWYVMTDENAAPRSIMVFGEETPPNYVMIDRDLVIEGDTTNSKGELENKDIEDSALQRTVNVSMIDNYASNINRGKTHGHVMTRYERLEKEIKYILKPAARRSLTVSMMSLAAYTGSSVAAWPVAGAAIGAGLANVMTTKLGEYYGW